jgi:hypothetical protein
MVTFEQKKKNKQYILDPHDNFYSFSEEQDDSDYYYIYKGALTDEDYQELYQKVDKPYDPKIKIRLENIRRGEEILADLSNWELGYRSNGLKGIYHSNSLKGVRNKQTGQEVKTFDCGEYEYYIKIIGELGYIARIFEQIMTIIGGWLLKKNQKGKRVKKKS